MKTPTPDQRLAYRACLRFDRLKSAERGAGRSGFLSAADEAEHRLAYAIIVQAMNDGAVFDLEAETRALDEELPT